MRMHYYWGRCEAMATALRKHFDEKEFNMAERPQEYPRYTVSIVFIEN